MRALLVLTSTATPKQARDLAEILLKKKAAACVSFGGKFESHYRWKGKYERTGETMLFVKTIPEKYPTVEKLIKKHHPYENPEVLAFPAKKGSKAYLSWMAKSLQ